MLRLLSVQCYPVLLTVISSNLIGSIRQAHRSERCLEDELLPKEQALCRSAYTLAVVKTARTASIACPPPPRTRRCSAASLTEAECVITARSCTCSLMQCDRLAASVSFDADHRIRLQNTSDPPESLTCSAFRGREGVYLLPPLLHHSARRALGTLFFCW